MSLFNKNTPFNWTNHKIIEYLDEFIELYKERPIKDNFGGMKFPHMFGLFFLFGIRFFKILITYKGSNFFISFCTINRYHK